MKALRDNNVALLAHYMHVDPTRTGRLTVRDLRVLVDECHRLNAPREGG